MDLRNIGIIAAAAAGVIGISWATNRALNSEWVNGEVESEVEVETKEAVKSAEEQLKKAASEAAEATKTK